MSADKLATGMCPQKEGTANSEKKERARGLLILQARLLPCKLQIVTRVHQREEKEHIHQINLTSVGYNFFKVITQTYR